MYKKTAHYLTAGCLLELTAQAYGVADGASQAVRQSFAAQPSACTPALTAAELQAPSRLHDLYARQAFLPLWQEPSRRAALLHELEQLADDGLEPRDYRLDSLRAPLPQDPQRRACADLLISHSYLHALQHLARGRLAQEPREPFWQAPASLSPTPRPGVLGRAGPQNPRGQLVIRFANPFAVYLHAPQPAPVQQIAARLLASGKTTEFPLRERLPIVLAYWTAGVNGDGALILRNDLYARDRKLLVALRGHTY